MKRLEDRIFEALQEEGGAVGAAELARRFLGVAAGERAASRIVEAALARDRRFRQGAGGLGGGSGARGGAGAVRVPVAGPAGRLRPGGPAPARVLAVAEFQPGEAGRSPRPDT